MMLIIQAAKVDYAYGGHTVLAGATFEIRQGESVALALRASAPVRTVTAGPR